MRGIGGAEQEGKRERAIRFAVSEDADNQPPQRLSGTSGSITESHE